MEFVLDDTHHLEPFFAVAWTNGWNDQMRGIVENSIPIRERIPMLGAIDRIFFGVETRAVHQDNIRNFRMEVKSKGSSE